MYAYTFDGTEFVHKETINHDFPSHITTVSITNDHMFLAFMVYGSHAYVYKYDGTNFTLYQNITMSYNTLGWRWIHMTDDHQYLVVSGGDDRFIRIY